MKYIYIILTVLLITCFTVYVFSLDMVSIMLCDIFRCAEAERIDILMLLWISLLPSLIAGPHFKKWFVSFLFFLPWFIYAGATHPIYYGWLNGLTEWILIPSLAYLFVSILLIVSFHIYSLYKYKIKNYSKLFTVNFNSLTYIVYALFFVAVILYLNIDKFYCDYTYCDSLVLSLKIFMVLSIVSVVLLPFYNKRK